MDRDLGQSQSPAAQFGAIMYTRKVGLSLGLFGFVACAYLTMLGLYLSCDGSDVVPQAAANPNNETTCDHVGLECDVTDPSCGPVEDLPGFSRVCPDLGLQDMCKAVHSRGHDYCGIRTHRQHDCPTLHHHTGKRLHPWVTWTNVRPPMPCVFEVAQTANHRLGCPGNQVCEPGPAAVLCYCKDLRVGPVQATLIALEQVGLTDSVSTCRRNVVGENVYHITAALVPFGCSMTGLSTEWLGNGLYLVSGLLPHPGDYVVRIELVTDAAISGPPDNVESVWMTLKQHVNVTVHPKTGPPLGNNNNGLCADGFVYGEWVSVPTSCGDALPGHFRPSQDCRQWAWRPHGCRMADLPRPGFDEGDPHLHGKWIHLEGDSLIRHMFFTFGYLHSDPAVWRRTTLEVPVRETDHRLWIPTRPNCSVKNLEACDLDAEQSNDTLSMDYFMRRLSYVSNPDEVADQRFTLTKEAVAIRGKTPDALWFRYDVHHVRHCRPPTCTDLRGSYRKAVTAILDRYIDEWPGLPIVYFLPPPLLWPRSNYKDKGSKWEWEWGHFGPGYYELRNPGKLPFEGPNPHHNSQSPARQRVVRQEALAIVEDYRRRGVRMYAIDCTTMALPRHDISWDSVHFAFGAGKATAWKIGRGDENASGVYHAWMQLALTVLVENEWAEQSG